MCPQASSPQLAPASQKEDGAVTGDGQEKENEAKTAVAVVNVAGTEVPLRDKILMKSVSNQSTDGKTQGLSMFDNRTKVSLHGGVE